jgi:aminoglycoside phosphotransferase family enzyme
VSEPDLAAKVAFLRRPEAHPDAPRAVETVETHMAYVFLGDRHAYKLKKPVRHDELDFSTPELRRRDCEEEVRLNRRLAPDVYLGVVRLCFDPARGLSLGGAGDAIDWLVWMRRLPADRMLDELIRCGKVEARDVRDAARALAVFYAKAPPIDLGAPAYRRRLEDGLRGDLQELCRPEFALPRGQVERACREQLALLAQRAELFDQRVSERRIVEGHGDLRPEHICLVSEPVIIDCLEFSRELRIADPADELSFLGLECERLGRPEVGRWFLDAYSEVTGDRPPEPLLRFHRAYRALRRAKIAAWHLLDPGVRDREPWRARARDYLDLAAPGAA